MLEVNNLKTKYVTRFHEDVYAVDGVSLKIEEGKSLGVAGESGCGKSTLALSLMGYYFAPLHYISGDIIVDGRKISGMKPDDVRKNILGNEIAYIPQAAMNALNPTQKIIRFVEDVIHAHDPKMPRKDIYDLAKERFQILGLPEEVLQKHAVELSGGMKQRTVIAISTILSPKVLIADEPSSALDVTSQKMVIKMMRDLMEKGFIKSMIFITHELPLLYNVTDDIMVMYAGQIVEKGNRKRNGIRSVASIFQRSDGIDHRSGGRCKRTEADCNSGNSAKPEASAGGLPFRRPLSLCTANLPRYETRGHRTAERKRVPLPDV